MGGSSLECDIFGDEAVVGAKNGDCAVISQSGVHGDDNVHAVECAPVQQFRFAAKVMEPSLLDFPGSPLYLQAFLRRNTG